jgi:hypothetical protein
MKIAIVSPKVTEDDEKVKALCEDSEKKKRSQFEERICEFFNDTTSDIIMTKNEPNDLDGPVSAPNGRHKEAATRDAWVGGAALVVSEGLKYFMPRTPQSTTPYLNPYQYNFSPYGRSATTMGVADTILFNARYHGAYGYYMPTPGAMPYTAFGGNSSMISPYQTLNNSSGLYFSF